MVLNCEKMWVEKVVLCFMFVLLVPFTCASRATINGGGGGSNQKLDEVQNLLKSLNKPAVKSIKSPDGDIIDCVNILQQPTFDHPALKNHNSGEQFLFSN
ncbi:hypothetical protein Lal_00018302 [Lupinus albus]|uniref:Putative neprosin activation peptide n=1 Tax=Lupinus albus TaxID=3870 RepID=A0A6A5LZF8_LUPAL|nr:putative neprosin activation peptide [Lupinus albus]KAF1866916.1 hypothetical protein Lal_00018302 [Lupinus albus]